MEKIFTFICIMQLTIQIISIVRLKKTEDSKYWNLFIGISVAFFFTFLVAYTIFQNTDLSLNIALICLLENTLFLIINIIMMIIGLIIKLKIKTKNIKIDKTSLYTCILTIIMNTILIVILPIQMNNLTLTLGGRKIINYLNNKYGNNNYKVIKIDKEYAEYGIIERYISKYYYEIKSNNIKDKFIVSIDNNFKYIEDDYFLPVYYSQKYNLYYNLTYDELSNIVRYDFSKFNNYIKKEIEKQYAINTDKIYVEGIYKDYVKSWSNINGIEYNPNYYIVSANNGKIPTIEELTNQLIKYN